MSALAPQRSSTAGRRLLPGQRSPAAMTAPRSVGFWTRQAIRQPAWRLRKLTPTTSDVVCARRKLMVDQRSRPLVCTDTADRCFSLEATGRRDSRKREPCPSGQASRSLAILSVVSVVACRSLLVHPRCHQATALSRVTRSSTSTLRFAGPGGARVAADRRQGYAPAEGVLSADQ
jgi:hypothetical protein